jgi:hypothetical protein
MGNNQPPPSNGDDQYAAQPAPARPRAKLAAAWHNSAAFKIMVIGAGLLIVTIGGMTYLSHNRAPELHASQVAPIPALPSTPGLPGTPKYDEQVKAFDRDRHDDAQAKGTSSTLTPQLPPATTPKPVQGDDLARYAAQAAEPSRKTTQPDHSGADHDKELMAKQLDALRSRWTPAGPVTITVSAATAAPAAAGAAKPASTDITAPKPGRVIERAMTIRYGMTRIQTNSDAKLPVIVDLLAGPFKGGSVVGTFDVVDEEFVLHFNILHFEDQTYTIDAIGVDPDQDAYPMVDDVEHHYLQRLILPAAASFIAAWGAAAAKPNTTIVLNGTSTVDSQSTLTPHQQLLAGLGGAASNASGIINQEAAKIHPTSLLDPRRPVGVLFLKSVTDQEDHAP